MIFDMIALVAFLTVPVLLVIALDEWRHNKHLDSAVEVGNSWKKSSN